MSSKLPKVGATLVLDNDKAFKQALSEINAGLKVNRSELALVSAQYKENGQSQDALRSKIAATEKTIASQTDKVKLLESALKSSIERTGESSKETMQWQTSLNKAQTELVSTQNELNGYREALAKTEKQTVSVADVVNRLCDSMGVSLPPAVQSVVDKFGAMSASGAALITVVGGITAKLVELTLSTADAAGDIKDLADKTGMTVEQVQELNYAAEYLQVSASDIGSMMARMTKNMDSAREGSGSAADAFEKLHVRVEGANGQLRNANDVFYDVVDALGNVKNSTERDALAMSIFGKSAQDLNILIAEGSDGLKKYAEQARATGNVMDSETIDQFDELSDQVAYLKQEADGLKNTFAMALLPILTELIGALTKLSPEVVENTIKITMAITTVVLLVKTISDMTKSITSIADFFSTFSVSAMKTKVAIAAVIAAIIVLLALIVALSGKTGEFQSTMNGINGTVTSMQQSVSGAQQNIPRYAKGTRNHPGGPAIINDDPAGRYGEIVDLPSGARVYPAGVRPEGVTYHDNRQFIFRVDDIDTFKRIMQMLENEKMNIRQGAVKF